MLLQVIINGLMMGGVYVLVAVGLSMIHGVMKIVNFAQADMIMIGMYITYLMWPIVAGSGVPYYLLPILCIIMFLIGVVVYRLTISHVVGKGSSNYILLTCGLSYFLQYGAQLVFGPTPKSFNVNDVLRFGSLQIGNISLPYCRIIMFAVAAICVIIMTIVLNKTYIGLAMRATSESEQVSLSLGVNTKRIFMLAFGLATTFAGIAGLIMTPQFFAYTTIGVVFSSYATAAVVIGSLGSMPGALVGGLLIGIVESLSSTYLTFEVAPIAVNILLVVVLMVKPDGLFGGRLRIG